MQTVVLQINNDRAFSLLESLEALNVIKLLKGTPRYNNFDGVIVEHPDRAERLAEIRSITKDIHLDLTNFRFNRDEANNYDE